MLRNIILAIISTHLEVTVYDRFEAGQISALMTIAGIEKLWRKVYIKADSEGNQISTYKVETDLFNAYRVAKFKKMVDTLNYESSAWRYSRYYDVKFMVPVRDSKEIEALV